MDDESSGVPHATDLRNYGTLNDLDGLRTLEDLYHFVFAPRECKVGIVTTGKEVSRGSADGEGASVCWGRSIVDEVTGQSVQMRFSPLRMRDGEKESTVALVVLRSINLQVCGSREAEEDASLRLYVLFDPRATVRDVDVMQSSVRTIGAACLPMWRVRIPMRGEAHGLAPGAYKLMNEHRSASHIDKMAVAPPLSQLVIAGAIAGVHVTDVTRRLIEPITRRQWKTSVVEGCKQLRDKMMEAELSRSDSDHAMGASVALVELLTADAILALQGQDLFSGALPSALVKADGIPLIIAMACRIAMHPERYELLRGNATDCAACGHAKMLFESCHQPMDVPSSDSRFAIDLAIRSAVETVNNVDCNLVDLASLFDGKQGFDHLEGRMYWQSVGQHVLTALFGLGATTNLSEAVCDADSDPRAPERDAAAAEATSDHHAWRMQDPLAVARDDALRRMQCKEDGLESTTMHISELRDRKRAWLRIMSDVEEWLSTGMWRNLQITPVNSETDIEHICNCEERNVLDDGIDEQLLRAWQLRASQADGAAGVTPDNLETLSRQDKRRLFYQAHNLAAHTRAVKLMAAMLKKGPCLEQLFGVQTYLTSEMQFVQCATCSNEVHILQAAAAASSRSTCIKCSASICFRCLKCLSVARKKGVLKAQKPKCRYCGVMPCVTV